MTRGRQVQGHHDVEGQCEDRKVPLAEDGAQGTGEDGAEGRRTRDDVQEGPNPDTRLSRSKVLPAPSWRRATFWELSLTLTGPEQLFLWACSLCPVQ